MAVRMLQHAATIVVGSSRIHMRNKMCELILEHHIVRLFISLLFYSKKKTLYFSYRLPLVLVNDFGFSNESPVYINSSYLHSYQ